MVQPRLTTPNGVSSVEEPRSSRLRLPAVNRKKVEKVKATGSRLLKLALSGETAYNFLNNLTGDALGDYEEANGVTQFVADTFLSPVGLASAVLAPVTGGSSLGLRGAAGAAARIGTRAGAELGVNAAANLAGKAVESVIPEDAPGYVRAGAMLAGAVAGGVAAGRGISALDGTATQRAAARAALQNEDSVARGLGFKHITEPPSFSSLVDSLESKQLGEGVVGKVQRGLNQMVGASPASNYKTRLGAIITADAQMAKRNQEYVDGFVTQLLPTGNDPFVKVFKQQGNLWEVNGQQVPWQTVVETKDAVSRFKLTPEQAALREMLLEVHNDGELLRKMAGLKPGKGNIPADRIYFPHISTADAESPFLRVYDREASRLYQTVEKGMEGGIQYADPVTHIRTYLRSVHDEVLGKEIDDAMSKFGMGRDSAALSNDGGKLLKKKLNAVEKQVGKTKADLERARLSRQMTRGQAQSEINRRVVELREAKKFYSEYQRALQTSGTAEFPAPRSGPNPVRSAELKAARAEFRTERQLTLKGINEPEDLIKAADEFRGVVAAGKMPDELAAQLAGQRDEYRKLLDEAYGGLGSTQILDDMKARIEEMRTGLKDFRVGGGDVEKLAGKLVKAREKLDSVRKEWTNYRNRTWDKLPGAMWGRQDNIPVALWRNKYYVPRDEDYATFARHFDTLTGAQTPVHIPSGLKAAEQVANLGRFTAATADWSAPFVQGLPLLAYNPKAWANMAFNTYKAWLDPGYIGRYYEKNWPSIRQMIDNGVTPGEIEMLKAAEKGGLADMLFKSNKIAQATGVSSAVQRFQASYDTTMLMTRHMLWDALLPVWKADPRELAKSINNMTGGLQPSTIGVGPTRQALESMVFFAPRMLRSTLALVGDAMRPWTPAGELAVRTLARTSAAMAGVMILTNLAVAGLNGEDDEKVNKRLQGVLDPSQGRKFLSVEIGDHYYGVGGQVRGITQLISRALTDPKSLLAADALDNPLIRYASGRLSPGANTALGAAELMTDEEHNFLPFNTIDSVPDLVGMSLTSALPFAIQSGMEEGWDFSNPATFASPFITSSVEAGGLRASKFTPNDLLEKSAQDRYGMAYSDLTGMEQAEVEKMTPGAAEARAEFGDKNDREYRARRETIDTETRTAVDKLQGALEAGKLNRRQYREARSEVLKQRGIQLEEAQKNFGVDFGAADSPKRQVTDAYFQTFEDADLTGTGQIDWDHWEYLQSELNQKIESGVYGDPQRAKMVLEERRRFDSPTDDWFEDNSDVIRNSGYWETTDAAYLKVAKLAQKFDSNIHSVTDLQRAITRAGNEGNTKLATQLGAVWQTMENISGQYKEVMRVKNPRLDRALFENGYVSKVKTKKALTSS